MNCKKILTIVILSLVCLPTALRAETINVPRESVSNSSIIDIVEETLIEHDFKYDDSHKSQGALVTTISEEEGNLKALFISNEKKQLLMIYIAPSINIPKAKRKNIAEFLTRCNYNMILGNIDMDFSDGEIRYRWAIDVEGGKLSHQMVISLLVNTTQSMIQLKPYIMKICYGDMSPEEAYEQWKEERE